MFHVLPKIETFRFLSDYQFRDDGGKIAMSELGKLPDSLVIILDNGYVPQSYKFYVGSSTIETYNTLLYVFHVLNLIPAVQQLASFVEKLKTSTGFNNSKCFEGVINLLGKYGEFFSKVIISDIADQKLTQEQIISEVKDMCKEIYLTISDPSCLPNKGLGKSLLMFSNGLLKIPDLPGYALGKTILDMTTGPRWAEHHFMIAENGFTGKQFIKDNFDETFPLVPGMSFDLKANVEEYSFYAKEFRMISPKEVIKIGDPKKPSVLAKPFSKSVKIEFKPIIESVSLQKESFKASPASFALIQPDNVFTWKVRNSLEGVTTEDTLLLGTIALGERSKNIYGKIYKPSLKQTTEFCTGQDQICVELSAPVVLDNYPVRFKIVEGGGTLSSSSAGGQLLQEVTVPALQNKLSPNFPLSSIASVVWNKGKTGAQRLEAAILDDKGVPYTKIVMGDASDAKCGAYVAPNEWREFQCHNLGAANTDADPFAPSWEINGGYWQWGRKNTGAKGPTGSDILYANAGAISGWNTTPAPKGAWRDTTKTSDDPCPAGYRIPTKSEWSGVVTHNEGKTVGSSWLNGVVNYESGRQYGDKLFLPAAGVRLASNGVLTNRGARGGYWSSEDVSGTNNAHGHFFDSSGVSGSEGTSIALKASGQSVRCIKESKKCGAYVAPNVWKEFMCHNLGVANPDADPFTPSWEING
ncbi:MAG: hypothetical protein RL181_1711, partial [Bacteroidota bacterium]